MLDQKLEVVVVPVSDVDRAKKFYKSLGWREDADFKDDQGWRGVQLTPPGSACSILFGQQFTSAKPGSLQGTFLVVENVDAARAELKALGADVTEVYHFDHGLRVDGEKRLPGRQPQNLSYLSFASFSDPDGNTWTLQEVTARLPGRGVSNFDVASMTALLRETEQAHGAYEAKAPKHHWSDWYSAYMVARQLGVPAEEAAHQAARNVESRG